MTPAGWCGPRPGATSAPWRGSPTRSARSAAPRSSWQAADAAGWAAGVVARRCPQARICLDPSHIVAWATDAPGEVRRETWNAARRGGDAALAKELKGARFALWKNPGDLTARQRGKLARIAEVNRQLYRAYLLTEELRLVFRVKGPRAVALLDAWLAWARRCRIPAFVELAAKITRHRGGIVAALTQGLSNALVESTNTKIRLLTQVAFGSRSPQALIALAMLALGGSALLYPDAHSRTHG